MLVFAGYVKRFLLCTILCRPIGTSKIKVFSCILTLSCGGQILWYNVGLATHNQRILTVNVNVDAAKLRTESSTCRCVFPNVIAICLDVVITVLCLIDTRDSWLENKLFILVSFFSSLRPFSERPLVAENAGNRERVRY